MRTRDATGREERNDVLHGIGQDEADRCAVGSSRSSWQCTVLWVVAGHPGSSAVLWAVAGHHGSSAVLWAVAGREWQ